MFQLILWSLTSIIFFSLGIYYTLSFPDKIYSLSGMFFLVSIFALAGSVRWIVHHYENSKLDDILQKSKENPTLPKEDKDE